MKKIYRLLALPLLLMGGCQSDDTSIEDPNYVDPNTLCELSYSVEGGAESGSGYSVAQSSYLTLKNESQGMFTHSWSVNSADAAFMVDGFDAAGDIASQVDPSKGVVSTSATDYLYFPVVGDYTLTLNATFVNEVEGALLNESLNRWVVKKSIAVHVVELSVLEAKAQLYDSDGVTPIMDSNLTINPGKKLYFKNDGTGADLTESWSCKRDGEQMALELEQDGSYTFVEDGTYSDFVLAVESSNVLYGDNNEASSALELTLSVESIQLAVSACSVQIDLSASHGSDLLPQVSVALNGVVADLVETPADVTRGFSFNVVDYLGAQQSVGVTAVSLDSSKGALLLDLDAKLYEGDVVTLSYAPVTGDAICDEFSSANSLKAFTGAEVAVVGDTDLFAGNTNYDFETDDKNPGNNSWSIPTWVKGCSIDTENSVSGNNSLYFNDVSGDGFTNGGASAVLSIFSSKNDPVPTEVPAGNYLLQHSIRFEGEATAAAYYAPKHKEGDGNWTLDVDRNGVESRYSYPASSSEWQTQAVEVSYGADCSLRYGFTFYTIIDGEQCLSNGTKMWYDKFELIPIR